MKKVFIFGAGGHAKVIVDILEKAGREIAFLAIDELDSMQNDVMGYPLIKGRATLLEYPDLLDHECIIAIGDNPTRRNVSEWFVKSGFKLTQAIHPSAIVGRDVFIGAGSVIMAGVVVNSGTVIGENVIINTSASIDHDCSIGNHVHIAPGCHLCGSVKIGEATLLGVGCSVIPGVKIGKQTVIGAGSTVITDLAADITALGSPAIEI